MPNRNIKIVGGLLLLLLIIGRATFAQPAAYYFNKARAEKADSQKIVYYKQGFNKYKTPYPDTAELLAQEGLKYALEHKYILGEAEMIGQLAMLDQRMGRPELAVKRANYAMSLYRQAKNTSGEADMYNALGAIAATKGDVDVAQDNFFKSLKLHEQKKDTQAIMVEYTNIGALYLQQDDTLNSGKYLRMAEKLSEKLKVSDITISLYNYLGILHLVKGERDKAMSYFENNVKMSAGDKFVGSHVEALIYLGSLHTDEGHPDKAMACLDEALQFARNHKMVEEIADIYLEKSNIIKGKNKDLYKKYMDSAAYICEKMGSRTKLVAFYEQQSLLKEAEGEYKDALVLLRKRIKLTDSINNSNRANDLKSIAAVYELEKSDLKVTQLENLNKRISTQRNTIIVVSFISILGLIITFYFYTKSVRLNKMLRAHEAELEESNKTKTRLFSVIGHDLRWPVARIPTVLDMYEDPETTPEEKEFLMSNLKEHTIATVETLDKLLYWGQSLMTGVSIKQVDFAVFKYVEEGIRLKKIALGDKEIKLVNNISPAIEVYADPTHFDFVFRNLLANAIKYTGIKGEIILDANAQVRNGYTVFSVKDNGIGMDANRLKMIFSAIDSRPGTAKEKGTGIGLMLCKEFIHKNGGEIWVESTEGKGATFYFSLKTAGNINA